VAEYAQETVHLTLLTDKSPILSIGAGGTIEQDIEEDTNNPRIWDTANSKLLSIHILNSADFEEVTGMLPPETPVTADVYAKLGLPFYELYTEKPKPSKVGGGTVFGALKTLSQIDAANECKPSFYYDPQNPPHCAICRTAFADCL
jgi:hypothetical protein